MFIRLFFFVLVVLIGASCSQQRHGTVLITGRFSDGPGIRLVLEELVPEGAVPLDSLTTGRDGTFRFAVSPAEATFFLLKTGDGKMAVLTAAPGDTLELVCDLETFPEKMAVSGPEDAVLLAGFYAFSSSQKARSDSLQAVLASHNGDSLFASLTLKFDTLFRQIWERQRTFGMAFIEQHPSSFASLIAVNYSFGVRPVLSMEQDMKWYKMADSALTERYPGNRHVLYNRKRITDFETRMQLKTGTGP